MAVLFVRVCRAENARILWADAHALGPGHDAEALSVGTRQQAGDVHGSYLMAAELARAGDDTPGGSDVRTT